MGSGRAARLAWVGRAACHGGGRLILPDIFVPHFGMLADITGQQGETLGGIEVDDVDAQRAEPLHAALKVAALADNQSAEAKLADQPAAIPAGSERRDHGELAITALASGVAEGVGFAVERRIAILHAAVATGAEQLSAGIENRGADRNASFGKALAGFSDGYLEQRVRVGQDHGE